MRRDVSLSRGLLGNFRSSSLHAQRCFLASRPIKRRVGVFSACAEMFLSIFSKVGGLKRLLCMRRDVSEVRALEELPPVSSLHAQRCFLSPDDFIVTKSVFSACAEMFPPERLSCPDWWMSSLHAQRCFRFGS